MTAPHGYGLCTCSGMFIDCGACRRKKDHGRAEALLIAAWAAHMRPQSLVTEPTVSADLVGATPEPDLSSREPAIAAIAEGEGSAPAEAPAPTSSLQSTVVSCDEQQHRLAANEKVLEQMAQSATTQRLPSQQTPDASAMDDRQRMHAEAEVATTAAPLTADQVAARIEAVKRRMLANAAPSEVESMAAFLQTLHR